MTIPADDSEYTYTGNGSATAFDGPRTFEEDHISVYTTDSSGTTSHVTSGYTVSKVGPLYTACLVTFDSAPADGVGIDIRRTVPYEQNTSVRNQGVFHPEIHENTFDWIVMMIQQLVRNTLQLTLSGGKWVWNALGLRIINVGNPIDNSDAANKEYVDDGDAAVTASLTLLINEETARAESAEDELQGDIDRNWRRTLRTPDYVNQIPYTASQRANQMLGFDSFGNPRVIVPETGSAADILTKLASSAGATMIGMSAGGSIADAIGFVTPEMFGCVGDGRTDDSFCFQKALDFLKDENCKYLWLRTGAKYKISSPLTAYAGSKIIGDRHGIQNQGEGTNAEPDTTPASRAANPIDSAILWYGDTGKTWITCERNVTISGVVFGAPEQNWDATEYADVKDYGTAISGVRGLNILSCVYYGMTNFVVASSECIEIRWNTGFCNQVDYAISNSADIVRINDNHGNPNAIRPNDAYFAAIANSGRVFISLTNHDGAFLSGNFGFRVSAFIKNYSKQGKLGSLNVVNCFADQSATFLDNDTYGSGAININNGYLISGAAQDPSGAFILRKTNGAGLSTPIFISNFVAVKGASPLIPSKYTFYLVATSGYKVHTSGFHSDLDAWDSGYTYNIYIGDSFRGNTYYEARNKYINYLPNPGLSRRNISGGDPSGWGLDNCTISYMGKKLTASSSAGGSIACAFRAPMPPDHTYIVKAETVGSSQGVDITEVGSDGTSTTNRVAWSRVGGAYYAVYVSSRSSVVSHTVKVYVQTDSVNLDYAALVSSAGVNQYNIEYYESGQPLTEVGAQSYTVLIEAGATYTIVADPAATSGVYDLYVSSSLGVIHYQLTKLTKTSSPTITQVSSSLVDGFSYTVAWPDSSLPTVAVSDTAKYRIVLVGASPTL